MPGPRSTTGSVTTWVVGRPVKLNGVWVAVGDVLKLSSPRLAGAKISALVSRGYLKAAGQLPARATSRDFRPFDLTSRDRKKATP